MGGVAFFERFGWLMRKQREGGKNPNYEYVFALYNSASVRKYDAEISARITFAGVPFSNISLLFGVPVGKIFSGVLALLLSKQGVSFCNFGTVRVPLSN